MPRRDSVDRRDRAPPWSLVAYPRRQCCLNAGGISPVQQTPPDARTVPTGRGTGRSDPPSVNARARQRGTHFFFHDLGRPPCPAHDNLLLSFVIRRAPEASVGDDFPGWHFPERRIVR